MKRINQAKILGSKTPKIRPEKTKFQKLMRTPVSGSQFFIAIFVELIIIIRAIL